MCVCVFVCPFAVQCFSFTNKECQNIAHEGYFGTTPNMIWLESHVQTTYEDQCKIINIFHDSEVRYPYSWFFMKSKTVNILWGENMISVSRPSGDNCYVETTLNLLSPWIPANMLTANVCTRLTSRSAGFVRYDSLMYATVRGPNSLAKINL